MDSLPGSYPKLGNKYREAYTGNYAGRSGDCPLQEPFSPVRSEDTGDDVVTCAEVSIYSTAMVMVGWSLSGFVGCGMYKEKRTRTWETLSCPLMGSVTQLNEECMLRLGESDPFIVVGDGRTDHRAKGRAQLHLCSANNLGRVGSHFSCQESYINISTEINLLKASNCEEPYAVVPHVGICEGAVRQRAVLP